MYFPDLSAYRFYCNKQFIEIKEVKNIGWLQKDQPYPTGTIEDELGSKLREVIFTPDVIANRTRGLHACDLCSGPMTERIIELTYSNRLTYLGSAEIWIPSLTNTIFAAPTLIYHYITEHSYHPPDAFVEAVLAFDSDSDWNSDNVRDALFERYCRQD